MSEATERSVLYVDDDELARAVFKRALQSSGFSVTLASSAYQAIEFTAEKTYDAVVSDLRMPGMDGFSLLDELHAQGCNSPFVLTSGVPDIDRRRNRAGVAAFLWKPWTQQELTTTLSRIALNGSNSTARDVTTSVLVVEDNPADAHLIARELKHAAHPYPVDVVGSLGEAIEALHIAKYQVVFTDLGLTDANGLSAVEKIRRVEPDAAIIVVSGNEDEELALDALSAGAQDYVAKDQLPNLSLLRTLRFGLQRKRTERRLSRLAECDELTGLANRKKLNLRLVDVLARNRRSQAPFGLLYIDLDGFKPVNDTYGHEVGDEILQIVATRLQAAVREYDTCARIGGDEFAVIIEGHCDVADATMVSERIVSELRKPYRIGDREINVGASAGLAMYPQIGVSPEVLMRAADQAMYRCKEQGGGRCIVAGQDIRERYEGSLESRVKEAVRLGALTLSFQPVVSLANRRVEAVEALLRWNQEDVEAIPPSVFVPVLEKLGLITEVGAWALDAAAAQLKQWDALGLPPLVASVNISPHQFENGDLVEVVNDVLSRRSLAATRMELELTESTLMRNTRASNVTLRDLKDRGLRLAIDDFGTGYSSLAYLSRFRVDVLKVDRSFVQEIGRSDDSDAIISAILSLGQQLNLEVTAEGIETDEQLAFIEERGCHRAQGYLFCRPVSAAKIEELLGRGGTP